VSSPTLELKLAGHPIPENDIWIAALARQHNLPVVSRDLHFRWVEGLKTIAW
jgi:predicted nucleic acid-binding protein